jgi:hypothetical protein
MGMASIAHQAPSRSVRLHIPVERRRELAILVAAFVLFLAGLALALTLHGSHAGTTLYLDPVQTQTAL